MLRLLTASFARPNDTTAYADGDLVANSTTAGSVVPLTWVGRPLPTYGLVRRVFVRRSSTGADSANFRLYLIGGSSAPTVANGDNAAFSSALGDNVLGTLTGSINIPGNSNGRMGIFTPESGVSIAVDRGSMWGLLMATGAYAPTASETFTLTLEISEVLRGG